MRTFLQYGLIIIIASSLICCGSNAATQNDEVEKKQPKVQNDKYKDFALKIEESINKDEGKFFNQNYDLDYFAQQVTGGIGAPDEMKAGFIQGINNTFNIGKDISQSLGKHGSYKLLRIYDTLGEKHLLYRLINKAGLNYHIIKLSVTEEKQIKIKDVFAYTTGEWLSYTIRKDFIVTAKILNKEIPKNITKTEEAYAFHFEKYTDLWKMALEGKSAEVLRIIKSFPIELQHEKNILFIRMKAAANMAGNEYENAVNEYKKAYPGAAELPLLAFDGYVTQRQYNIALENLFLLEKNTYPDNYLNILKAHIWQLNKEFDKAEAALKTAIANEKTLTQAYVEFIGMYISQKNYKGAVSMMDEMQRNTKTNAEEFLPTITDEDFMQSQPYLDWKSKQKAK